MQTSTILEIADIAESDNTLSSYKPRDPDKPDPPTQKIPQKTSSFFSVRPSSYHKLSIFSCICCCCPVGLAAFIYSYQTRRAKENGDFQKAEYYSKSAKDLSIASIALGVFMLMMAGLIGAIVYFTHK